MLSLAYASDRSRLAFDNMWKKSYELIVNCNVIIERSGESNNALYLLLISDW